MGIGDNHTGVGFRRSGVAGINHEGLRDSIEFYTGRVRDSADIHQGRHDIDGVGKLVDLTMLVESGGGPVDEERHAMATVVLGTFLPSHAGVEDLGAGGGTIVGGENEDGVVCHSKVGEKFSGLANVVIDVGDHSEKGCDFGILILVEIEIFLRAMQGAVRGVGGNVSEEGFLFAGLGFDEIASLFEEDVGAEPLG